MLCAVFALTFFLICSLSPKASDGRLLPVYSVDTKENAVAITFDCAWTAEDIPLILKTLDEYEAKATFFVVGSWAEKYPESVRLLSENGHEVAGHSYNHAHYASLSSQQLIADMAKCDKVLYGLTGKILPIFRAPYGEYNNTVVKSASDSGRTLIQWDVDSLDWKNLSEQDMLNRILPKVRNGSILLFHNGTKYTASALPAILSALREEGYRFVPVGELLLPEPYIIDHEGRQKSAA